MRRLSPLGNFLKWVLFPLILFALGYFVLGPSAAKQGLNKPDEAQPGDKPAEANKFAEPDVKVSVRKAPRHRPTVRKPQPKPETPVTVGNPTPGGATQDTGDTGGAIITDAGG